MSVEEKAKTNTQTIKEQIDRFDNKASILIAVVSIVFAISLSMVDVFEHLKTSVQTDETHAKYISLIVFACLYIIAFILEMIFLVSVIYPRKKKEPGKKSLLYYYDISEMNNEEIKNALNEDDLDTEVEQLKVNSLICRKKHKRIICAVWTLIPLFAFAIVMFIIAIVW